MLVLLGTPNASSTLMIATTLTHGDPSYAGPLAGGPLGLPVYHVLEEQVKEAIPREVYEERIGPMEFVLDKLGIEAALARARSRVGD
jgi:glycine reductase